MTSFKPKLQRLIQ